MKTKIVFIIYASVAILILSIQGCLLGAKDSPAAFSCFVFSSKGPSQVKNCILKNENSYQLTSLAASKIYFDRNNLRIIQTEDRSKCFWASKNQKMIETRCFVSTSDDFKSGLSVFKNDKALYGYIDKDLEVVIPAQYKYALGFKNKLAKVCFDCTFIPNSSSEHLVKVKGTKWSVINKDGKVISDCIMENEKPNCEL